MAVSATERAQYAYNAGFRNGIQENGLAVEALSIITAISLCECGVGQPCETSCVDVLGDATCGITQFDCTQNPATCRSAVDPQTAMNLAWELSSHGTAFNAWATYTQTSAPNYFMTCLPAARAAVAAITPAPAPPPYVPPPPPHYSQPPPQSSGSDAGVLLLVAGVGLIGFALERTRPGSILGILRSAPQAGGIRSGSTRPILRR